MAAYYERVTVEGVDTDTVADMAGAVQASKDRLIINGYAGEYEAYSTAWSLGAGQMLITLPGMAAGIVSATGGSPLTGYTSHGLDQAIGREGKGVSPGAILDAVKNPLKVVPQEEGKMLYRGKDAVVILNQNGLVISTWARNHNGWRIK